MKRLCLVVAAVGGILLSVISASAAVDLNYVGFGPYSQVGINVFQNNDQTTLLESHSGIVAGFYQISLNGGPVFNTFCIDIADSSGDDINASIVPLASAPDSWAGPMGATAASTIERLWAKYYSGAIGNASEAGALQVAIWMAIDLARPEYNLQFSGSVTGRAEEMLANPGNVNANLMAVTSVNQDFLVPVPEPTTVLAGALLLLPFAASTIRRFRKS